MKLKEKMFKISVKMVKTLLPKEWVLKLYFLSKIPEKLANNDRNILRLMELSFKEENGLSEGPGLEINKHELRIFSQNGEDGILAYIFSKVGILNRKFVEIGVGNGTECNTANLSLNFGWQGLLIDSDKQNLEIGRYYYQKMLGMEADRVKIVQCFVTVENINKLLTENGVSGEIDLLSIDIDGNDFWVWERITKINPRVVVMEYNSLLGLQKALVVKYDPQFDRFKKHASGYYHGASLAALNKLAMLKGYVLIGCDSSGTNTFFVRQDVAKNKFKPVSVKESFLPQARRLKQKTMSELFGLIKDLPFETA